MSRFQSKTSQTTHTYGLNLVLTKIFIAIRLHDKSNYMVALHLVNDAKAPLQFYEIPNMALWCVYTTFRIVQLFVASLMAYYDDWTTCCVFFFGIIIRKA